MSKCINSGKHEWYVFGTGFQGAEIECDILCSRCGKTKTVVVKNTPEVSKRVLDSAADHKQFKIPRSAYIRQY